MFEISYVGKIKCSNKNQKLSENSILWKIFKIPVDTRFKYVYLNLLTLTKKTPAVRNKSFSLKKDAIRQY
jgi:hypothetical protein